MPGKQQSSDLLEFSRHISGDDIQSDTPICTFMHLGFQTDFVVTTLSRSVSLPFLQPLSPSGVLYMLL